jgi:hypothetical protein
MEFVSTASQFIMEMHQGAIFKSFHSKSDGTLTVSDVMIFLDVTAGGRASIFWCSHNARVCLPNQNITIFSIQQVTSGHSRTLLSKKGSGPILKRSNPSRCLTIISPKGCLDLEANSQAMFNTWMCGLRELLIDINR